MKHITTTWVLLVGLVLAGTAIWIWNTPQIEGGMAPESAPIQAKVASVDRSTRAIQSLTAALADWNANTSMDKTVALIAEAPRKQKVRQHEKSKVAAKLEQPAPAHQVNMIYLSSSMQRAIVDGHYLGPGDALPDGTKVVAIQKGQVVLRQKGHREVVKAEPVPVGFVQ